MLHHLSFDDRLYHVLHAGPLREQVLAGLEVGARLEGKYATDENESVRIHDAFALEQIGDVHHAGARRNRDNLVLLQWARRFESALAENHCRAADDEHEHYRRENSVADDYQRIARASRRAAGYRHMIGLQGGARAAWVDAFRLHENGPSARPELGDSGSPAANTARPGAAEWGACRTAGVPQMARPKRLCWILIRKYGQR